VPGGRTDQLRQRRAQRQQVGAAGVDPAQQRVDQPLDDLRAEPTAYEVTDADVVLDRRTGQHQVERHAVEPCRRQQAAAGEGGEVAGDPQDRAGRQRAQAATAPDRRGARRGWHQLVLETGAADQGEAVRHPREHRVGALVDGRPATSLTATLPPSRAPASSTHDLGVGPLGAGLERRCEAGDTPTDHDDAHPSSVGAGP
jgi:hypothetical protein